MPELSRFYGIQIKMYFDDHHLPRFHALYAGDQAVIEVETMAVIAGTLLSRAFGLVVEWASLHQAELRAAWNHAQNLEPTGKIDPLA